MTYLLDLWIVLYLISNPKSCNAKQWDDLCSITKPIPKTFVPETKQIFLFPTYFQYEGSEPVYSVRDIQDGWYTNVVHIIEKKKTG